MDAHSPSGWQGVMWKEWEDLSLIRARLDAGADPNSGLPGGELPLHAAAAQGSAEVVAELAGRVDDIEAEQDGRTALWAAVFANRPENARILASAGADPWRPMMAGWSPARLNLAGPEPELFGAPRGGNELTAAEAETAAEARRLITALGDFDPDGIGLACVAGISATEAARRLEALPGAGPQPGVPDENSWPGPVEGEEVLEIAGVTDVPGGCVVTQPWGYAPSMHEALAVLSAGTICFGMYANPASTVQGSFYQDGVAEETDLQLVDAPYADDSASDIFLAYLYQDNAVAYSCAYAGLQLTDARAITGPPDILLRLPPADYWR